ncbi:hypothetical protein [Ensifer canadensis]
MAQIIELDSYREPAKEPIDLLDPKLDLTVELLDLVYVIVKEAPDNWDRFDIQQYIYADRKILESREILTRRKRDLNNTRNCLIPMLNNRSDLESTLIDAHIDYEQCARALQRARTVMLTNNDKASRKAFEAALRNVNDAELAKNRAETALTENARTLALQYL